MARGGEVSTRLLFRCDSGADVGFGHFTRCLGLARTAREVDPRAQIAFWGRFDAFALGLLARHGVPAVEPSPDGFTLADAPALLAVARGYDAVVLDSYEAAQDYVDALATGPARLCVVDDMHVLDLSRADLAICFRAGAEATPYGARREALGLRWLAVPPELRAVREANLQREEWRVQRVLVFLSGRAADPTLLAALVHVAALPGADLTYITRDGRPLPGVAPARVVAPGPGVEDLYRDADFVVCGGGLVKYESAYCGVPNACVSQTGLQAEDTRRMAARGLTLDLGDADAFDPTGAGARLRAFATDAAAVQRQRAAFRGILDTDSPRHLARLLLSP
jgi:spore coat polysaccharide biosynthesis predicted glycosyltransferase SpsG